MIFMIGHVCNLYSDCNTYILCTSRRALVPSSIRSELLHLVLRGAVQLGSAGAPGEAADHRPAGHDLRTALCLPGRGSVCQRSLRHRLHQGRAASDVLWVEEQQYKNWWRKWNWFRTTGKRGNVLKKKKKRLGLSCRIQNVTKNPVCVPSNTRHDY